jgi:hypothetical protein
MLTINTFNNDKEEVMVKAKKPAVNTLVLRDLKPLVQVTYEVGSMAPSQVRASGLTPTALAALEIKLLKEAGADTSTIPPENYDEYWRSLIVGDTIRLIIDDTTNVEIKEFVTAFIEKHVQIWEKQGITPKSMWSYLKHLLEKLMTKMDAIQQVAYTEWIATLAEEEVKCFYCDTLFRVKPESGTPPICPRCLADGNTHPIARKAKSRKLKGRK